MAVNQLNATAQHASVVWQSLILENAGLLGGRAAAATAAAAVELPQRLNSIFIGLLPELVIQQQIQQGISVAAAGWEQGCILRRCLQDSR
jgi:hypothetical protein